MIYYSQSAMQAVDGGSHVEGILFPFGVRAKSGLWFSQATDFGLDVFASKPLLSLHMLDGKLQSHGVFLQDVFEKLQNGLFCRSTIDDSARQFMAEYQTGFSGGSVPHLVQVSNNGHVDQWVLIEGSYGHVADLDNYPGTTTAHIQSCFPGVDLPDSDIVRGIFVMPGEIAEPTPVETPVVPPVVVPEPAPGRREQIGANDIFEAPDNDRAVQTALANMNNTLDSIETRLQLVEDLPTRSLPEPDLEPEAPPSIQVASVYDGRSLLGMLFEDDMKSALAFSDKDFIYTRSEEWYKALMSKVFVQAKTDVDILPREIIHAASGESVWSIPDRMVSIQAYDAIHEFVPYLQADEVMRTGFTGFGEGLIPVILRGVFYHYFRAKSEVFGLMEAFNPGAGPTYDWPVITGGPTFYLVKEAEDADQLDYSKSPIKASKLGTGKVTFNAGGIGSRTVVSAEEIKWSSGNLLDAMALEYMLQAATDVDWVLANGDETATTANISSLNAAPDADDKVLAIDGLRHDSIVTTTADSQAEATVAKTTPGVGRGLMGSRGRIGRDISKVVMIAAPESADKFDALDAYESIADVGASNATLLNGQVGAVKGVPLIASEAIELADADGKYDAVTSGNNVKGQIVFLHRDIHKVAIFEELFVKTEFIGHANAYQMYSRIKLDQKPLQVGGTADLYNNTVT